MARRKPASYDNLVEGNYIAGNGCRSTRCAGICKIAGPGWSQA